MTEQSLQEHNSINRLQLKWKQFLNQQLLTLGKDTLQNLNIDNQAYIINKWFQQHIERPNQLKNNESNLINNNVDNNQFESFNNNQNKDKRLSIKHQLSYLSILKQILLSRQSQQESNKHKIQCYNYVELIIDQALKKQTQLIQKSQDCEKNSLKEIKKMPKQIPIQRYQIISPYKLDQISNKIKTEVKQTKKPHPFSSSNNFVQEIQQKNLQTNKYFKLIFKHFCSQTCTKAQPTFDDLASAANQMNITKWMVFCKQFDFTQKISKNQLSNLFKKANNFSPLMNFNNFVETVLKIKRILKIPMKQFEKNTLKINCQSNFRQKMNNLKIQYFGVRRNFDYENRINESKRKQEIKQSYSRPKANYKSLDSKKKKQSSSGCKLSSRSKKNQKNQCQIINLPKISIKERLTYRQYLNSNSTYLSLFKNKKNGYYTQSTTGTNQSNIQKIVLNNSSLLQLSQQNKSYLRLARSSIHKNEQTNNNNKMQSIKQYYEIDLDSDAESDQILRTHFKNEKKTQQLAISTIIDKKKEKKQDNFKDSLLITEIN